MLGSLPAAQNELFYDFCLEDYVPQDNFLRQIDQFLDFSDLRKHLSSFYSHTGRPSIDPELMIRMLIVGYCYGIRSERRLCEEVHLNLAYRWFCRLGLRGAQDEFLLVALAQNLRKLAKCCYRPPPDRELAVFM